MTKKSAPKPDPKPDPELDKPAADSSTYRLSAKGGDIQSSTPDPEQFRHWQRNEQRRYYAGVALMGLLGRGVDPAGIERQAADIGEALAAEIEKRGWLQR